MPIESEVKDLSDFIQPDSDQLNADDLITGPRIFTVRRIAKGAPDSKSKKRRPRLIVHLVEFGQPWKPCVGMQRVLCEQFGLNPAEWPEGLTVELYRDPLVTFGGKADDPNIVGGIRISGLSHIDSNYTAIVSTGRGSRKQYPIRRLETARPARKEQQKQDRPTADLAAVLADAELAEADADRWLATKGKPAIATLSDEERAKFGGYLAGHPEALDAIRAIIPTDTDTDEPAADEGEE